MKKVLLAAVVALFAIATLSSCHGKDECVCKTYLLGVEIDKEIVDNPTGEKCSKMSDYVPLLQSGMKCK